MEHKSSEGEIADLVCEFLEVAIHTLLSVRGLYPSESFERRRHFNVPVQRSRHPDLIKYIESAISTLKPWIQEGVVEKIAIVVLDNQQMPLERFIFKFHVKQLLLQHVPVDNLEFSLRAFLLKIPLAGPLLCSLPPDCSWEIAAYSKRLPGDKSSNGQYWIPADNITWAGPPQISPIKSMSSDPLDVQLYIEHPMSGASS